MIIVMQSGTILISQDYLFLDHVIQSKRTSLRPSIWVAFWCSLRVLNIYNTSNICYKFWALTV